ncbi:MAG: hypothetical protein PHT48_01205 [Dechloromonas sp.]|nr:hypothetical protein [Dechloromonas sp.]
MDPKTQSNFQHHLNARAGQSLPARILAFVLSIGLLVVGFMFSLIVLAVVAVLGALLAGWFWWKTRALRQAARQQGAAYASAQSRRADEANASGIIIEGEVVRETTAEPPRRLS